MRMRADDFSYNIKDEGWSWRNIGIGALVLFLIGLLIAAVVWMFRTFGDPTMSKEAREKKRILDSIIVFEKEMTVSKKTAKQRALNIDNALRGVGYDKWAIAKQFVHADWWPYLSGQTSQPPVSVVTSTVVNLFNVFGALGATITVKGALNQAKLSDSLYGTKILLNIADREMIAKEFGVRKTEGVNWLGFTALSTKDWFTLRDWITYENDQDLSEALEALYAETRILV